MTLPAPNLLGLPKKYTAWRPHQSQAVEHIISSETPFITQIAPTGSGKSLTYVSAAHLSTNRSIFLTSTKGLMNQLSTDFTELGIVTVKGKNSYMCKAENDGSRCDVGPCNAGFKCGYKESGGCPYYDAIKAAQTAPLVVTNYAFWMTYNKYAQGLALPDMLVCDEAHDLPQLVSDFLTCRINRNRPAIWSVIREPSSPEHMSVESWAIWADAQMDALKDHISLLRKSIQTGANKKVRSELRTFINLKKSLTMMSEMDSETWIMDVNPKYLEFAPIWPKLYTNDVLFLNVPKILLTSATVCGKTTQMLGITTQLNSLEEFPHTFPVENRRLIHIPTVRLNIRSTDLDIREWTRRIDQILRTRLDRKGIVHTVSYLRRNHILAQSELREHMMTHSTEDAIKMVHRFKNSEAPKFLVSPSMTTGYDFPDDTCRIQIIGKVAYPDTRNKIVKARCKEDTEYGAYIAAQQLVQAVGRSVRSVTDWSENFVIDDNIKWFMPKYKHFMPDWFTESYQSVRTTPKPKKIN